MKDDPTEDDKNSSHLLQTKSDEIENNDQPRTGQTMTQSVVTNSHAQVGFTARLLRSAVSKPSVGRSKESLKGRSIEDEITN